VVIFIKENLLLLKVKPVHRLLCKRKVRTA